ncbi:MarR family transcriptional regulator [Orenia metallireducens]|jgi:DNA-binding MarR family transcriptional regulator|uniref:HTH-type transcriptional regulator SarZ n=1 Tax=Orenia metallireducens TaxID=1413210 RepID=A0A1C0A9D8_9FIRM|nr:MarR family transcriptional regulator [Orenia metallireducens]OCL26889.1 MarR family transcriptional regulator [Orenia metallireducens]
MDITNDDLLKIENQLCFPIYVASKEIIRIYKPYLKKLNLTYTQYIVMLVLWEEDNISVKDIGEKLYLDSGTLTPVLKKLEKMNLVERKRSKEDERVLIIALTEKGKDLKERAFEIPTKAFCKTGLTEEDALLLKAKLDELVKNLINN